LTKENINEIKDGSIIAIGQNTPVSKNLKIRHIPLKHYHSFKKINMKENICIAIFNQKNRGYAYISSKNGLLSASIGFRLSSKAEYLQKLKEKIKESEGFDFDKWTLTPYSIFAEKIQLFKKYGNKKMILAGYISGFFDPFFNFGVNSALVSGKIAAITVNSKKQGIYEFNKFTNQLKRIFVIDKFYSILPLKNLFVPFLIRNSNIPVISNNIKSIPGFTHENCLEIENVK
jgi:flavin-dependent dehydrogenase